MLRRLPSITALNVLIGASLLVAGCASSSGTQPDQLAGTSASTAAPPQSGQSMPARDNRLTDRGINHPIWENE
jgi:hypothetical protein